ncbi:NADH-quinone oxidoreductase subunit A [candidate division KSB1 bacterium]|nr:MAG: NADH-quinone oxidoreductase subunit A [candidate division KSB1 bacterium]
MSFTGILIFFIAGASVVALALAVSRLLAPHHPNPEKTSTYECGELPVGSPWVRFNTRFYVVALIFLIFDVEVLFVFPWAVSLHSLGLLAWIDMAIFIVILAVGLAYVWGKGDLDWVRPRRSSEGPEGKR